MNFEGGLKKGVFMIGECINCKKIVWPPSEFCNQCFNEIHWREGSNKGKIIEFSKQGDNYFCVVEFENMIKVMGNLLSGIPTLDKQVKIEKCGIKENDYFFEFSLI